MGNQPTASGSDLGPGASKQHFYSSDFIGSNEYDQINSTRDWKLQESDRETMSLQNRASEGATIEEKVNEVRETFSSNIASQKSSKYHRIFKIKWKQVGNSYKRC